jgi:AcrR family transcriptional regulator
MPPTRARDADADADGDGDGGGGGDADAGTDVSTGLLDAAERLFYRAGVQAVSVDAIVAEAGVATKTLYARFGSKEGLVEAYLRRRDQRWLDWLRVAVAGANPGPDRVLAVFDALHQWFTQPGYNGCAFINVAGELATNTIARAVARQHKRALRALLAEVAVDAGATNPGVLADGLMLLVEGSIVTAHVEGDREAALRGRAAAVALLLVDTAPREVGNASPGAAGVGRGGAA